MDKTKTEQIFIVRPFYGYPKCDPIFIIEMSTYKIVGIITALTSFAGVLLTLIINLK